MRICTPCGDFAVSVQADYYAHPDQYQSVFAKTIAPYASVIGKS
jgi:hypothetical protein